VRRARPLATLLATCLACLACFACAEEGRKDLVAATHGDPSRGPAAFRKYGCHGCHAIPGVPEAQANAGPPLSGLQKRLVLAGEIPHTTDNLVDWIRHPKEHRPGTVMPDMGVTEDDARDMAAYLYSIP
jgi:cytochrome c